MGGGKPHLIPEAEQDLLPGGVPNTPTRRIMHEIRSALSLPEMQQLFMLTHHKTSIWCEEHTAGILMRATTLLYSQAISQQVGGRLAGFVGGCCTMVGGEGGGECEAREGQGPCVDASLMLK